MDSVEFKRKRILISITWLYLFQLVFILVILLTPEVINHLTKINDSTYIAKEYIYGILVVYFSFCTIITFRTYKALNVKFFK